MPPIRQRTFKVNLHAPGSGCATTHESPAGALGIPESMPPIQRQTFKVRIGKQRKIRQNGSEARPAGFFSVHGTLFRGQVYGDFNQVGEGLVPIRRAGAALAAIFLSAPCTQEKQPPTKAGGCFQIKDILEV